MRHVTVPMPEDHRAKTAEAPQHPGRYVRVQIIKPLGLSVKDAAMALGVHRVALSRFLNQQASLSPEMAIRLAKAFGADMEELMRMQNAFDIARAHAHEHEINVRRYKPEANDNIDPRSS